MTLFSYSPVVAPVGTQWTDDRDGPAGRVIGSVLSCRYVSSLGLYRVESSITDPAIIAEMAPCEPLPLSSGMMPRGS